MKSNLVLAAPKIFTWQVGILLTLLCLLGAGCGSPQNEKKYGGPDTGPAYGDLLIDASIGDASTLIPPLASDAPSHEVAGHDL